MLVSGEIFISVSRNYVIIEKQTLSPYLDDEVAIIVSKNYANEFETTMVDILTGSTFKYASLNPNFIACSTLNSSFICAHIVA